MLSKEQQLAKDYLIFKCVAGSHAYGTSTPQSDKDERGVFIAPPEYILTCFNKVEQVQSTEDEDTEIYELRKFFHLAANNNPNLLELLYTPQENIIYCHPLWEKIRSNKDMFLSKKAKFTFSGYAVAQLKRIKGHKKWINSPHPVDPPLLSHFCSFMNKDGQIIKDPEYINTIAQNCFLAKTFGTTQFRVYRSPDFFKEKLGFFCTNETQCKYVDVKEDLLIEKAEFIGFLWINQNDFDAQHKDWKSYWDWKKNRNPQRAELENKYGFDGKHASHLVRLMRMCKEILVTGNVIVKRPDAQELLDIRNGKFSYDELLEWAEKMDNELNDLYEKSSLPHSADYDAIDRLYRQIVTSYWRVKNQKNF